jgi:hypothetical protein
MKGLDFDNSGGKGMELKSLDENVSRKDNAITATIQT